MSDQAAEAARLSDHVFFVIDARAGVTPVDRMFAERIRKLGKPVTVLANKAETRLVQQQVPEAFALGFGEPFPISGEHGEGLEHIYAVVKPLVVADRKSQARVEEAPEPDFDPEVEAPKPTKPLKLAIIGQPKLLMLDEPSMGLAPQIVDTVFELLGKLRRVGQTILLVEQNAELAMDFAQRCVVLGVGEVQLTGTSEELRSRQDIIDAYLGTF